jgi:serine/threonine protein kinase
MLKKVEDYILLECIGQGRHSRVFRAVNDNNKQVVAAKVVPRHKLRDQPAIED